MDSVLAKNSFDEVFLHKQWFHAAPGLEQALRPLLKALHWKGGAQQLLDALPGRGIRLDQESLRTAMALLGYRTHRRHGHVRMLPLSRFPCLFMPGRKARPLVVIKRLKTGFLVQALHETQPRVLDGRNIKGTYFHFEPHAPRRERTGASWFTETLKRFDRIFLNVLWLGLVINSFALVVPFFTMLVYDRVMAAQAPETLPYLLAGALIALCAEIFFRLVRGAILARFGARLNYLATCSIFHRFLELDPLLAEQTPPAAQMTRVKTFEAIREFFTGQNFILLIELPFLLLILAALFCLSPGMAATCLGTGVLFAFFILTQMHRLRTQAQDSAQTSAARQSASLEIFTKVHVLQTNGMRVPLLKQFDQLSREAARSNARFSFAMHVIEHAAAGLGMIGGLIAISVGLGEVWAGHLTPGGLIASMILVWRILGPLQQLASVAPRLNQVGGALKQMDRLLGLPTERLQAMENSSRQAFQGDIDFVNVAMRYGRGDPVFSGIGLSARAGELVAVTGGNGSGKSSLLKLVNGMYRQAAGAIRIDGIDIRQLDVLALRRGMTYIPQAVTLFTATVRDNIRMAAPLADDDKIMEALVVFDGLEDIRNLPQGLDTVIGPAGMSLSEILSFKIMLARAYVGLKPILLCDELPYAILNSKTGARFRQWLSELKGYHTVFFVAHTEDLIALADKVILLRQEQRHTLGAPGDILTLLKEKTYA